jgi:hypothetical protein
LLISLAAFAPAHGGPHALPAKDQKLVNDAIDLGARYLKLTQNEWGTWTRDKDNHPVAYAALPALTLLECGLEPDDLQMKRAALFVRLNYGKLDRTYDLALTLLFLDRLGDKKDRKIIQTLALRLIAGQSPTGGWSYKCPILTAAEHRNLLSVLQKLNPKPASPRGQKDPTKSPPADTDKKDADKLKPVEPKKPGPSAKVVIPGALKLLPVLRDPDTLLLKDPEDKLEQPIFGTTDNSNSQFAFLALWAARRHGVPIDRSLKLIVRRYTSSQNTDGSWNYRYKFGGTPKRTDSASMTAAGLLGLAIGNGLVSEGREKTKPLKDPKVVKGFVSLTNDIGLPTGRMKDVSMGNLYFLWSVERVGMLYDLPTIGKKDWYRWGAEILVANQKTEGNWTGGGYPGSNATVDTCLALLFLKKANFAEDLTAKLPFSPTDLSKDIEKKLPPSNPNPPKEIPKAPGPSVIDKPSTPPPDAIKEPVKETRPPPSQTAAPSATETKEKADDSEGGSGGILILGGLLLVGLLGLGAVLFFVTRAKKEEEDSDDLPRKSKRHESARSRPDEEDERWDERPRRRRPRRYED